VKLDRRSTYTRGRRSRRASIRKTVDELTPAPTTVRIQPAAPLAALLAGRNPEPTPPPAAEDEDQTKCGYCGGVGCERCEEKARV
jgi:hypothetical protein